VTESLQVLARRLGCVFQEPQRLQQALTHRSAGAENNERLEFLGDALLGFVIAETLWQRFPQASEGQLTRLRAALVRESALAELARTLDLGAYLQLGRGERRDGGQHRDSILSDALEALFAAVYLDQGFGTARSVILKLYEQSLEEIDLDRPLKDPKTRLQEQLQAAQRPLPQYEILAVEGPAHAQSFLARCTLLDRGIAAEGRGKNRRTAEQAAAERMLAQLDRQA